MNRNQTFTNEQGSAKDICNTNIYAMVGVAQLAETILGEGPFLNDLACTQATVPNLTVYLEPGEIYSMQNIDNSSFGPIPQDTTHQILKTGVLLDRAIITLTAPGTPGDSIIYLIQVEFSEVDDQSESRPYFGGPPQATLTRRADLLSYNVKAGTPATSPTAPAPDSGYVGAYLVTVSNGQTAIINSNIVTYTNAPFITEKLGDKISQTFAETLFPLKTEIQSGSLTYASTSGTDTYTASLAPALSGYTTGMVVNILFGNANTATNPTLNIDSLGAKTIKNSDGTAILAGQCVGQRTLKYDGTNLLLQTSAKDFVNDTSTNGYLYLPGGIILQWGRGAFPNSTTSVTLPVTNPTATIQSYASLGAGPAGTTSCGSEPVDTSHISVSVAGGSGTEIVHWLVIGH